LIPGWNRPKPGSKGLVLISFREELLYHRDADRPSSRRIQLAIGQLDCSLLFQTQNASTSKVCRRQEQAFPFTHSGYSVSLSVTACFEQKLHGACLQLDHQRDPRPAISSLANSTRFNPIQAASHVVSEGYQVLSESRKRLRKQARRPLSEAVPTVIYPRHAYARRDDGHVSSDIALLTSAFGPTHGG